MMTIRGWIKAGLFSVIAIISSLEASEKPFVFIVPSYNNKQWYIKNLESMLNQNYENFRVLYFDDCSTDGMSQQVSSYLQSSSKAGKITYIRNVTRQGALANIITGVHSCQPHEIVVLVDGDDWLAHNHVLEMLNRVYQDPDVWLTYGQYRRTSGPGYGSRKLPDHVIATGSFRSYAWVTSHLRTFYAGLFHRISLDDLRYGNGYFPMAWDLALMFPMLEMAGRHSRFIPDILYIYNTENPLNDFKRDLKLQQSIDRSIRNKCPYKPLTHAFWNQ